MSKSLAPTLNQLMADYSVYYQKLRTYHWTVKGPMFFQLHTKFEQMYLAAAERVDELAERVVGLGELPLRSLSEVLEMARLEEESGSPMAQDMVQTLGSDLSKLIGWLRQSSAQAGQSDPLTANMLEEMADAEEKAAWMLQAYLG
jgi:starvation-inducible DNA-binding protein